MQQLHRRKLRELEDLMAHPEAVRDQIAAVEKCDNEALKKRLPELRKLLQRAQCKELITQYLLEFMAFAQEDAEIQCEFAMKRKSAEGDKDVQFELSQHMNKRLQDLTRRYKQQFWPSLLASKEEETPYAPLQTGDVDDLYGEFDANNGEPCRRCTYRRINHFREYLRQQQGKSRVVISERVLDTLRAELKKHYYEAEQCTPQIVRYLLKNLNQAATRTQSKQSRPGQFSWALIYEHTPTITINLNPNYKLIDIPPERERLLCHLFEKTEMPFEKYKLTVKKGRKNFLSYPYMTYKLCELMGWDDYLGAFSLLKSDDLLILQDCYFKLICKDLNWQFVPTVGRVDIRETLLNNDRV